MPARKLPAPSSPAPPAKTGKLPVPENKRQRQIAKIDRDLEELERRRSAVLSQLETLPPTMQTMYAMGKLRPMAALALEGYDARITLLRDLREMSLEGDSLPSLPAPLPPT